MLGRKHYDQAYIDACRERVAEQVAAYGDVVAAANGQLDGALAAFEPKLFNNMVLVLDNLFVHRLRGVEGKDGNPANEVRVLCTSLLENGGVLAADRQIQLDPQTSVVGYAVGDEIVLSRDDFARLSEAYFAEIEKRFAAP